MMMVTTRTSIAEAPSEAILLALSVNLTDSGAPKMWARCALASSSLWITPTWWPLAMLLSTPYSDMKNGDCTRMGRQLESGLVPDSLYSFIISSDWRCRSFL